MKLKLQTFALICTRSNKVLNPLTCYNTTIPTTVSANKFVSWGISNKIFKVFSNGGLEILEDTVYKYDFAPEDFEDEVILLL